MLLLGAWFNKHLREIHSQNFWAAEMSSYTIYRQLALVLVPVYFIKHSVSCYLLYSYIPGTLILLNTLCTRMTDYCLARSLHAWVKYSWWSSFQSRKPHCPTKITRYTVVIAPLPLQADPIGELLVLHFPEVERRQVFTVDNVTMDVQGLRKLVVWNILTTSPPSV